MSLTRQRERNVTSRRFKVTSVGLQEYSEVLCSENLLFLINEGVNNCTPPELLYFPLEQRDTLYADLQNTSKFCMPKCFV